ncbi:hypothetical protein [Loktanella sp. SALINAS62]|uniref:hypothetical protein n=1 Tax=Loktanella sp. SALINAS62 TaxID=2706124 RepID=UPI001B8C8C6A|nr:hypothetical protein [Loktanella sp. SALINAS62]MBS1303664.1 hypothetical protein [Loktanella sp. SALINAS62]
MNRAALVIALLTGPTASLAQDANEPLSAIDWLSQSVTTSAPATSAPVTPRNEPSVTDSATAPVVTVTPLSQAGYGAVGAISSAVSSLPTDLWLASDPADIITLIQAQSDTGLPALHDLLTAILLTKAEAPTGAELDILLARIDKLLDLALMPQALSLMDAVDARSDPQLFRRWFDMALLTGTEDDACNAMQSTPSLAPTVPARVFCLARTGDWPAAALTLNTRRALGDLTPDEELLLSRFLDPELFEDEGPSPAPDRISPLMFRLREAVGEGLATTRLPLAFAYADLRDTVGLKSRLDAAERLALHGALAAPTLSDIYLSRTPSASGGIWDRVSAVQDFHAATRIKDKSAITATLPDAWAAMEEIRAEHLFATLYADAVEDVNSDTPAGNIARIMRMLAGQPTDDASPILQALLGGDPATADTANPIEDAIKAGFDDQPPSQPLQDLLTEDRIGEALLRAIAIFNAGAAGDGPAITDALRVLRAAGQDKTARRAAIELLLLDRRI